MGLTGFGGIWPVLVTMVMLWLGVLALRRVWRCGILGFWVPDRVNDRLCNGRKYAERATQQQRWLDEGDLRGIYGNFMPPAMFLEPEQCVLAHAPSNDDTPLLARAAAMVKRAEYIENHWGAVKASIDTQVSVEMMAIRRFLDRCAKREKMTYVQLVDYVRSSVCYVRAGDGSMPLSGLDYREMHRAS
jgi:hypothetical protein